MKKKKTVRYGDSSAFYFPADRPQQHCKDKGPFKRGRGVLGTGADNFATKPPTEEVMSSPRDRKEIKNVRKMLAQSRAGVGFSRFQIIGKGDVRGGKGRKSRQVDRQDSALSFINHTEERGRKPKEKKRKAERSPKGAILSI